MKATDAVRSTVVTSVRVSHVKSTDPFFPRQALERNATEVWQVFLRTRSGMLPERTTIHVFSLESAANDFASSHAVGTEVFRERWPGMERHRQHHIRAALDAGLPGMGALTGTSNAGDEESPLAIDTLRDAGVLGPGYQISQRVLDFLGRQRVGHLKQRFGENWSAAAEFEFCCLTLPQSSPAYIAAAYRFHWYITHDEFSAGYLWRDLECLVHGVETAAIKSVEMRQKAGAGGRAKSIAARAQRRFSLMAAIEATALRNPDIAQLGPSAAVALALPSCIEQQPTLWAQGRGQTEEYLGEIRRGEAGEEMQARYFAVFPTPQTA